MSTAETVANEHAAPDVMVAVPLDLLCRVATWGTRDGDQRVLHDRCAYALQQFVSALKVDQ